MKKWTALCWQDRYSRDPAPWMRASGSPVEVAIALRHPEAPPPEGDHRGVAVLRAETFASGRAIGEILRDVRTPVLAVVREPGRFTPREALFRRVDRLLDETPAGCLYSDYREVAGGGGPVDVSLPRFQKGSARDTFPLGPAVFFSTEKAIAAIDAAGTPESERHTGVMEIVYGMAERGAVRHVPERLYDFERFGEADGHFDYVRRENAERQGEMERAFVRHLRRTGAWAPVPRAELPREGRAFPVEASVVVPVRNRAGTIACAVESARSQRAPFTFNVLVVDNHSTDGTSAILSDLSLGDPRVRHIVPDESGLGIGGCWQMAIQHPDCGRYAVQLDSDDLYSGPDALARMVECLKSGPFAMAAGSYRVVDAGLNEIPPGVVDHREWTGAEGRNNLLRVEGVGAPRAFHVPALRTVGFPDVSYGEDYAVALAMSRLWAVGRVYDPVYLCRRWEGNTDSRLTPLQAARHHEFKDHLRTCERDARELAAGKV